MSLFHVGATTTAERWLSMLGGGGLSKSVALTWNEWTTGWRREKVAWRNRNLRLTKKSPAPVLHAPEGRPGNVHIAIPTPSSSFDESATLRPTQCIGKPFARTIVQRGCFESESEISKVTQEFLDRCIVRSNPLQIGDHSATKDRSRNP